MNRVHATETKADAQCPHCFQQTKMVPDKNQGPSGGGGNNVLYPYVCQNHHCGKIYWSVNKPG